MYLLPRLRRIAKWLLLAAVLLTSTCLYSMYVYLNVSPTTKIVSQYNLEKRQTSRQRSYVLAFSYMDQITWASRRVRGLQCWASGLERNMRVVEPFIVLGTQLGVPQSQSNGENLRFGDIFDLEWWNIHGENNNLLAMVTWKEFLHYAPQNVILVQIVYELQERCIDGILRTDRNCDLGPMRQRWSDITAPSYYTVVKELCINFQSTSDFMSKEEFNQLLFEDIPVDLPVTLVFNEFRGHMLDHKPKGELSHFAINLSQRGTVLKLPAIDAHPERQMQCSPLASCLLHENFENVCLAYNQGVYGTCSLTARNYLDMY